MAAPACLWQIACPYQLWVHAACGRQPELLHCAHLLLACMLMSHLHPADVFGTAAAGLTYVRAEGGAAAAAATAAPDVSTSSDPGAALPMISDKRGLPVKNALLSLQIRQQHQHLTLGAFFA